MRIGYNYCQSNGNNIKFSHDWLDFFKTPPRIQDPISPSRHSHTHTLTLTHTHTHTHIYIYIGYVKPKQKEITDENMNDAVHFSYFKKQFKN